MKRILIQLDTDQLPSSFDRVVAVDAGIDEVFSYGGVTSENVVPLVHGAMFTRGGDELKHTALFIGGSDVSAGEQVLRAVEKTFFGPMRVSVMMDSNGSNTTAAAAVLAADRYLDLAHTTALVLAGTGPVGRRAAQILAAEGAEVRVGSRSLERGNATCAAIREVVPQARLSAYETSSDEGLRRAVEGVQIVIAAGAAGVTLLTAEARQAAGKLQVAIDLNAVPPLGIEGVEVTDKAKDRDGVICFGAIGVGGTKMKLHKRVLGELFESNDRVLDTAAIYGIGGTLM